MIVTLGDRTFSAAAPYLSNSLAAELCDIQSLKGHSQLCDCADLDTSFSHFEKSSPQPETKVHLEFRFIFPSVLS